MPVTCFLRCGSDLQKAYEMASSFQAMLFCKNCAEKMMKYSNGVSYILTLSFRHHKIFNSVNKTSLQSIPVWYLKEA